MKKMSMPALLAAARLVLPSFLRKPTPTYSLAAPVLNQPTRDLPSIDLSMFHVDPTIATRPVPRGLVGATVRADAGDDAKALVRQIQGAFEAYKESVTEQLKAKADDVVLNERLGKIDATLSDLEAALDKSAKAAAAARLTGGRDREVPDADYSKLFGSFVREGTREQEEKLKSEQRVGVRAAMSEGSAADGGLTAPIEWDRTVTGRLKLITPMRQEATVQSISKAGFIKLFTDRAVGSGWVGETASRPATSTPQFTALPFVPGELYANAAASQDLLDDSEIDMENWLTGEIETEFSRQEGIAFVGGDGANKPFGFLQYVTGAAQAARHPWGDIKLVNSLAAAGITTDAVMDIVYALPAMYTPNAKFFMNRTSLRGIRKLKDGQSNYIWHANSGTGHVDIIESGTVTSTGIAQVAGDRFQILYNGRQVIYSRNGSTFRAISATGGLTLYLDSSIYQVGQKISGLTFAAAGVAGVDAVTGAHLIQTQDVDFPITSNSTSISITTFHGVLTTGETILFDTITINGLSPSTFYCVFKDLDALTSAAAYIAQVYPAMDGFTHPHWVYMGKQATSEASPTPVYPTPPTPPPGHGGGGGKGPIP